nr:DNA polymerase III subunit alpha [Sulfurospirillum sp.]
VQTIGGFSLGEADIVRRAMGKKQIDYMKQKAEEFAEGAVKQGLGRDHAIELFGLIEKFAGYGFNKSHSAAYAMITFQTAYLKCYYAEEFMAALLTSEQDNTDKVVKYIDEVKRLGIKLLPPSIQKSLVEFSAFEDAEGNEAILFGLGAIKGVGNAAISKILEARADAPFSDMSDFISRIDSSKVNKKVLESFIKSGSFDDFGLSRRALLEGIDAIIEASGECSRAKKMAESSLFGDDSEMVTVRVNIENLPEYEPKRLLELEKETIGFYISGHPLDAFRAEIGDIHYTLSSEKDQIEDGSKALFIGKVEAITEKISKKGNKFGIITLMDFHGSMELTVFEKQLDAMEKMDKDRPLCFKVEVSNDGQGTKMRVMKIMELEEAKKEKIETKVIEVPQEPKIVMVDLSENTAHLEQLYTLVRESVGKRPLHLLIRSKLQNILIETSFYVDDSLDEKVRGFDFVEVL